MSKNSLLTLFFLCCCLPFVSGQQISLSGENIPFAKVLDAIRQQTDYTVFGSKLEIQRAKPITIHAVNMDLKKFLEEVTKTEPFKFSIENKMIGLSKIDRAQARPTTARDAAPATLAGRVTRLDSGSPIADATIRILGSSYQTKSNADGAFQIQYPAGLQGQVAEVSVLGMETQRIPLNTSDLSALMVKLTEKKQQIQDVVVTGIFTRRKESFSGAASSYSGDDLRQVSGQNVLQSLNIIDPSFRIVENNAFGSDPNQPLNIEIRGKTSVAGLDDSYGTNPNQPLFIIDGFETSMDRIRDLSMDRVGSITILKDATATAMYGSKGANGVVVVETVKPKPGKLGLSYQLRSQFSAADLSDYNLMNAREKLRFELLAGEYGKVDQNEHIIDNIYGRESLYFQRLREVERGVDSYWLNEPLQLAVGQVHDLNVFGGDQAFQYTVGLNKALTPGVMRGSKRDVTDGSVKLIYRVKGFSFSNELNVRFSEASDQQVLFSQFALTNPYYRKYNSLGEVDKFLEYVDGVPTAGRANPLYDLNNNNLDKTANQEIINNFSLDWRILAGLNFRMNIGLLQGRAGHEQFISPHDSRFNEVPLLNKGEYAESNEKIMNYNSMATLTYGKSRNHHTFNLVAGSILNSRHSKTASFRIQGFADDEIINPALAAAYLPSDRPGYRDLNRREVGFLLNTNYGYKLRYLFDANLRVDGSSIYGVNKKFTTIWSVGGAWNLHNEPFMADASSWLGQLKLRASIGNLGNQNFNDYIATAIYAYQTQVSNPFGPALLIQEFGNPNLAWQKTFNRNFGLDFVALRDRIRLTLNQYTKITDPLLVRMSLPSSNGTSQFSENLGTLVTQGIEADLSIAPILRSDFFWRLGVSATNNKSTFENIGNQLAEFNKNNLNKNMIRYYDGGSPDDLWAVPSLGIDPATGREMFEKLDGEETFVYDNQHERRMGSTRATLDGNFNTSLFYKGFQFQMSFRYRFGGQAFMQTLYHKVENISQGNLGYNQDRRALSDRWQKPGDLAQFKSISDLSYTPMSSRFIQDNNELILQSVSVSYRSQKLRWLERIGAKSFQIGMVSNDLMHLSSIVNERGIDYPFARTVTMNLGLSF